MKDKEIKFIPVYDKVADYGTNAKSYYDYLAKLHAHIVEMTEAINRNLAKNLNTENTDSIKLIKTGNWQDENDSYDDVVKLKSEAILSTKREIYGTANDGGKVFNIVNAIKDPKTYKGLWVGDYKEVIDMLDKVTLDHRDKLAIYKQDFTNFKESTNGRLNNIQSQLDGFQEQINSVHQRINGIETALQKIVTNLATSGTVNSSNLNNFQFNSGRNIASGNINLFGGTSDGNSFIKTSNNKTNNDISAGY